MDAIPTDPNFTMMDLYQDIAARRRLKGEMPPSVGPEEMDPNGVYTTRELCKRFHMGQDAMRTFLREEYWLKGRLEVVKKRIPCMGSRGSMLVDAWRLLPPKEEADDPGAEE